MAVQNYLTLSKAFEEATGRRLHPTTLWRFSTKGSGGTVLQTWMLGGRRVTTLAAVERFIDERTKATMQPATLVSGVRAALDKELGLS